MSFFSSRFDPFEMGFARDPFARDPFIRDPFFYSRADPFSDVDRLFTRMMGPSMMGPSMMGPSMVGWPADYDVYSQQQQQPQQQQITGEQGTQQTEQQQQQPQQQTSQQLQQQQQPSQQQLSAPSTTTRQQLAPFMRGIPRLDITETPTSYIIHADLPGVKKEEININVKDDLLTISGERRASSDVKDSNRRIVERGYGRFSRSVRLPSDADAENVAAKMEGGVLELSLGKAEKTVEEGIRKIDIQ